MTFLGAIWHLGNLCAPAVAMGLFAALMAKALWRHDLAAVPFWRLWLWASGWAAIATLAGLVWFGRDGKIGTYAAMVVAATFGLWWAGFRRR